MFCAVNWLQGFKQFDENWECLKVICVCVRVCVQMMLYTCNGIMWRGSSRFDAPFGWVMCVCVGAHRCAVNVDNWTKAGGMTQRKCRTVLQNSLNWWRYITRPFVKYRNWSTNCETQYWSKSVQSKLPHTQYYKFHFNNILQYAQYPNCSISIIPCTTHSTPTTPLLSSTAVWKSVSFCAAHTLLCILLSDTNWILLYPKHCTIQAICIAHCCQKTRKGPFLCRQWRTEMLR